MKILGTVLKDAREKKGWSLEQLFDRTRIPLQTLKTVESGKMPDLPATYFRAFIRTWAKALKLDGDALIKGLDSRMEGEKKETEIVTPETEVRPETSKPPGLNRRAWIIIFSALGLILLSLLYVILGKQLFSDPQRKAPELPIGAEEKEHAIELTLLGLENSRITYQQDEGDIMETLLEQSDTLHLSADHYLRVGTDEFKHLICLLSGDTVEMRDQYPVQFIEIEADSSGSAEVYFIKPPPEIKPTVPEPDESNVLTGAVDVDLLYRQAPVFLANKDAYDPDIEVLAEIESLSPNLSIMAFFGSYDKLSQNVVPKLLSVKEKGYLPDVHINLIGVDRNGRDLAGLSEMHRVQGIPTIIILSKGEELGRIVGSPNDTIEKRILEVAGRVESL